jgi:LPXTG-motif cell wall-anchored protein
VKFALYKKSVAPANKIGDSEYTDPNGNIVWLNLLPGNYVLVEEATVNGYKMPTNTRTSIILEPGQRNVVILYNEAIAVKPTPKPTPTSTRQVRKTRETPEVTATPTPIPSDEVTIQDKDPAYGPETGEDSRLFIIIGSLILTAGLLLAIRKFVILKKVK